MRFLDRFRGAMFGGSRLRAQLSACPRPATGGMLLKGYGGLQASDQRTATALVASSRRERCRPARDGPVLVMHLGASPSRSAPARQSSSRRRTILTPTPLREFEKAGFSSTRHPGGRRSSIGRTERFFLPCEGGEQRNDSGDTWIQRTGGSCANAGAGNTIAQTCSRCRADGRLMPSPTVDPSNRRTAAGPGALLCFDVPKPVQVLRADQPCPSSCEPGPRPSLPGKLRWKWL